MMPYSSDKSGGENNKITLEIENKNNSISKHREKF
jgi:hypothetical protein